MRVGGVHPGDETIADALFSTFAYLPTSPSAARQAGHWKYAFARQGRTLNITDCLIAAVARDHDAPLVTRTVRDHPMPDVTLLPLPRPQRWRRGSLRRRADEAGTCFAPVRPIA